MRFRSAAAALTSAVLTGVAVTTAALLAAPAASAADTASAADVGTQVIGGRPATERYEFMTAFQLNGAFRCGGSLVARDWVVTAAHCFARREADGSVVPISTEGLTARVGSHDWTTGGSQARVTEIVLNPELGLGRGDLALLRLDHPVRQRPIRIAAASGAPGTVTRVLGWGRTSEDSPEKSQWLRELDTRIVPDEQCGDIFDPASTLCTEGVLPGTNACDGDSGGPQLQRGADRRWELVGATGGPADDDGRCGTGFGYWTDVTAYRDWIEHTV
ncbi:S1 family peptidase [Goodfellowiella coeruleoviolacea]|uniref:Trypsin n=1 Tax=Goodfellowiella coeruleoviolacea TaxID=334858 RepID=A0AAE3KJ49_9PSEU|nr:serine protease [Goodfellowiella coeruleoviolacea]MCP2168667.1 Trypsin [Goodfellowiella coeruleoviolacea]